MVKGTLLLARLLHAQVAKLQSLTVVNHINGESNCSGHLEIIVVTEVFMIDFAFLGCCLRLVLTAVGSLAKHCGISSVVNSLVASSIVIGSLSCVILCVYQHERFFFWVLV